MSDEFHVDLALDWLQQAYEKLQDSEESLELKEYFIVQIKEHLAMVHRKLGNPEIAEDHLNSIVVDEHMHPSKLTKKIISRLPEFSEDYKKLKESVSYKNFAPLCQGIRSTEEKEILNCYLDSSKHPFFILAPLQVEPLLLDPFIRLYHNTLNDEQISKLIEYAEQYLHRSEVFKSAGKTESSEKRVSQQAWVGRSDMPVAEFMYRFVGLLSGFNMTNAESMQVANYGVGGQYVPHFDFINVSLKLYLYIYITLIIIPF